MKYLFLFKIEPSTKFLYCIPIRITLILIALVASVFGIISFCGIFYLEGYEKDAYYYVIQAMGFISPILMVYSAFKNDSTTAYIALYFHSLYVVFISLLYLLLIILLLILSGTKYFEGAFLTTLLIQGIYIVFVIFANYVFYAFEKNYGDILEERSTSNQVLPQSENVAYNNIDRS